MILIEVFIDSKIKNLNDELNRIIMCGISGLIVEKNKIDLNSISSILSDEIKHRGPDGKGSETIDLQDNRLLSLIHRRLAIIDTSLNGHQPMQCNMKSKNWIIFNGEIYNYKKIKDILREDGFLFEGNSDTEVLITAYAKWGMDFLNKIEGMFAFALWDGYKHELLLAVDPLGIKPLYWSKNEKGFFFCSEIMPLLKTDLFEKKLDQLSVENYLTFGSVKGPSTIIRDINILESGSFMKVDSKGDITDYKKYWSANYNKNKGNLRSQYFDELNELMISIMKEYLNADVPLGLFLSGGIDSTALAYFASMINVKLDTFSVNFEEERFSEGAYARETANIFGHINNETLVSSDYLKGSMHQALSALDQPSLDGMNTFTISKIIHDQGIKVALSGLGGDEIFGGYPSFTKVPLLMRIENLLGVLPDNIRRLLGKIWIKLFERKSLIQSKNSEVFKQKNSLLDMYLLLRQVLPDDIRKELLFKNNYNKYSLSNSEKESINKRIEHLEMFDALSYLETNLYCEQTLLRDSDVMSMKNSVEIRVPYLDRRVVEFVNSVPNKFKFDGKKPKSLLIDATKGNIRKSIWKRPKQGFVFPMEEWFKNDLKNFGKDRLFESAKLLEIGLNFDTIESLWNDFQNSNKRVTWSRIWSLIVLSDWCERNDVHK